MKMLGYLIVVQQQIDTAVGMEIVKTAVGMEIVVVINTDTAIIVKTAVVAEMMDR